MSEDRKESLENRIKELADKLTKIISLQMKIEYVELLDSRFHKILEILSKNRPLKVGFVLIELASLLQELQPNQHIELVKECYILAFEIACDSLLDLAQAHESIDRFKRKAEGGLKQ